jgi:hypothetical protein
METDFILFYNIMLIFYFIKYFTIYHRFNLFFIFIHYFETFYLLNFSNYLISSFNLQLINYFIIIQN